MQGAQKGGKNVWRKKYYPQIKENTRKQRKKRQEKRDNIPAEKTDLLSLSFYLFFCLFALVYYFSII
jgi:hypothetical protein